MSSIKQVQDLEKQIDRVKRENSSLRRSLSSRGEAVDVEMEGIEQIALHLPEMKSDPGRRKRAPFVHDHSRARAPFRSVSKGLLKPPIPYRDDPEFFPWQRERPSLPEVLPRNETERLLRDYYAAFHTMFPIVHWPTLQHKVEKLYQSTDSKTVPTSELSMFLALLAVASLFSEDTPRDRMLLASQLLEEVQKLTDPWNNDFVLDDVRSMFLVAFALNELNLKSAAWMWLGKAVRSAQDLNLHLEVGIRSRVDADMRRRVWWAVYVFDRTLALELGRPFLIDDADCDVALPEPCDDHYLYPEGPVHPLNVNPLTQFLHVTINVVRSFSALRKALSAPLIERPRLATFDTHFTACQKTYPAACDPNSSLPIAPHVLMPLTYLLSARLHLHRHNLAPNCPPEARLEAIEQCVVTAIETANLITRTTATLSHTGTSLLATHIFRCTLILLFTGHWDLASTCIRALKSIDIGRDVMMPCARYLYFFIRTIAAKRQEIASQAPRSAPPGYASQPAHLDPRVIQEALIRDEELILYVSADMQGTPETAWVWLGAERDPAIPVPRVKVGGGITRCDNRSGLTEAERSDWGGWENTLELVQGLASGTAVHPSNLVSTPTPTFASQPQPPRSMTPMKMEPGTAIPRSAGPGSDSNRNSPTSGGGRASRNSERISIANII